MRREEEAAKKDDEVAGYVEPEPGPWREVHPDGAPFTKIQAGGRSIQKEEAEIQGRQSETKVREPTNERARHTRLCARQREKRRNQHPPRARPDHCKPAPQLAPHYGLHSD